MRRFKTNNAKIECKINILFSNTQILTPFSRANNNKVQPFLKEMQLLKL